MAAPSVLRSKTLKRAGFACPFEFDRAPKRACSFGMWQGWYVVHYQNYVGYAAAYIDT